MWEEETKKQENCVEWSVSHGIFGVKFFLFFSTPNKLIKFLRVLQKKVNKKYGKIALCQMYNKK